MFIINQNVIICLSSSTYTYNTGQYVEYFTSSTSLIYVNIYLGYEVDIFERLVYIEDGVRLTTVQHMIV